MMTHALDPPATRLAAPAPGQRSHAVHQRLASAVAAVAMTSAALGLASDGAYGSDEATVQMLRGFDAVTLGVVGPALLLAVRADRRGAALGRVVVASLLGYLGYTYAYHLLGAGFTDLVLLHAPLVTLTLVALVLTCEISPPPTSRGELY